MKRVLIHVLSSPFVLVTSTAALIHSSWTLAVIFGGLEPTTFGPAWLGWLIPGVLLAISVDVGLLQVSMEIKDGRRDRNRLAAFIVLAAAMFILQLAYAITHFPALALSTGVRLDWAPTLSLFRDSLIVIGPALLPIGITLHTFADAGKAPAPQLAAASTALAVVPQPDLVTIEPVAEDQPAARTFESECPDCDWAGSYTTADGARAALNAHRRHRHPAPVASTTNGRH